MSDANRVSIKTIPEVTYGVTPANGAWQARRFTGETLSAAPNTVISNEIRADRMVQDLIKVGEGLSGGMNIEHSMTTYDDLLEALLGGTWTGDVLEVGTEERSFSIEVGYEDWSPVQYRQFSGMRVNTFNANFAYGSIVEGGFEFAGNGVTVNTTSLVGSGTTAAATTTEVVQGSTDVSSVQLDGGAPGSIVRSIQLNVDNSLRPIEGIGRAAPFDQGYGRCLITGTLMMYFDDIAMYTKLIDNTRAALEWTVGDGVNSQTFLIPALKFNDGDPNAEGIDTDVMLPLNFTALFDEAEGTSLRITRA